MNTRHQKLLRAIFDIPTRSNIAFGDIEGLVIALGGEVREGSGSRIVFELRGKREYFHRPHPGKEAKKYQVEAMRYFLTALEVTP